MNNKKKINHREVLQLVVLMLLAALVGFWLGGAWQRFQYSDTCLDLGGGMNPGGYPICVVEKTVNQPTKEGETETAVEEGSVFKGIIKAFCKVECNYGSVFSYRYNIGEEGKAGFAVVPTAEDKLKITTKGKNYATLDFGWSDMTGGMPAKPEYKQCRGADDRKSVQAYCSVYAPFAGDSNLIVNTTMYIVEEQEHQALQDFIDTLRVEVVS